MHARCWVVIGAIFGAAAVGLGAFHAHGLNAWLEKQNVSDLDVAKRMANCETAVRYQLAHAPMIVLVGIWALMQPRRGLDVVGGLFSLGVLLFCGGLDLIVFTGRIGHWSIVPTGGLLLILAWLVLACLAFGAAVKMDRRVNA